MSVCSHPFFESKIPFVLGNELNEVVVSAGHPSALARSPARRTLEEIVAKFPQSDAAVKAKQRLGMR